MKCIANDRTYKALRSEALEQTVRFYAIIFASVLTDKYGFGKSKMQQIFKTVHKRAEEINEGRISLEDLRQTLADEYDIVIR